MKEQITQIPDKQTNKKMWQKKKKALVESTEAGIPGEKTGQSNFQSETL